MTVPAKRHYTYKHLETDQEFQRRTGAPTYLAGEVLDAWAWEHGQSQRKIVELDA